MMTDIFLLFFYLLIGVIYARLKATNPPNRALQALQVIGWPAILLVKLITK